MQHGDVVLPAVAQRGLQVLLRRHRAGGIVRVVEPHHLGRSRHVVRDGVVLGQPSVALVQGHDVALRACEHGAHRVHRVRRVRHQRDVAGIQEAERRVADAFLRADERQHLGIRVQVNVEPLLVPVGDGAAHFRQAIGFGVAMIRRVLRGRQQPVNDRLWRRYVRVADAEGHHIGAGSALLSNDA